MIETLVPWFVKNALAVEDNINISLLEWKQRSLASNVAEAKLPQVSYLPLTRKLHRHFYAPLLQLFRLVILVFSVSCISPTCSYQNMEGAQAEDLPYRSSMKLLPVCNRRKTDFRKENYTVKKKLWCAVRDVSLGDENVIRNLWHRRYVQMLLGIPVPAAYQVTETQLTNTNGSPVFLTSSTSPYHIPPMFFPQKYI